tara:strand:- start:3355 stop:4989 length:1635 start_codon:yes stop_codon:yes gene_type:complete
MPQYSPHPYPVGNQAAPFLTNQAPVTGNIGPYPENWTVKSGYVAPYRSFFQNLNNATYSLGPYARAVNGGMSGRLTLDAGTDWGFAQQCWYDYPRGALEQAYPENWEWWAETEKVTITVLNLISDNPSEMIEVEVAIGFRGDDAPERYDPPGRVGLFFKRLLNTIAFHIWGGECGTAGGFTIIGGRGIPPLPFIMGPGPFFPPPPFGPWFFGGGGGAGSGGGGGGGGGAGGGDGGPGPGPNENPFNDLAKDGPGENGGNDPDWTPEKIAEYANDWASQMGDKMQDVMDSMSDWFEDTTGISEEGVEAAKQKAGELLEAIYNAGDLFLRGWLASNMVDIVNRYNPDVKKTGTNENPFEWRPTDNVQEEWASYLRNPDYTGFDVNELRDYVNGVPVDAQNTNDAWFLTMLNRSRDQRGAYVDTSTNEYVVPDDYGFNRGGSMRNSEGFLQGVENVFGSQTADSVATFFDMSPVGPIFVASGLPIVALETIARARKAAFGESINPVTNLDSYRNTHFETRISADNIKKGNPDLYNDLVQNYGMQEVD